MKIIKLTAKDAAIKVEALQEDITPQDHFKNFEGNYTELIQEIERQIEDGNIYAWCTMKVECEFMGLKTTDYLGCCNYKSQQDFIDNSVYYQDMVNNCLDDLNKQIADIVAAVVEQ